MSSITPSERPVLKKEQTCSSALHMRDFVIFICVAVMPIRGRYGHARRCFDTLLTIFVQDVECAVLDPVPSPSKKAVRAQFEVTTLNCVHSPTHPPLPPPE